MRAIRNLMLGGAVLVFGAVVAGATVFALLRSGVLVVPPSAAPTPEQVFERASRSVVMVYSAERSQKIVGHGSAVSVHPALFATSCHVIAHARIFRVGHQKRHWPARLVAFDTTKDLCVLAVEGLDLPPATAGNASTLKIGQRVYAIGNPEGFRLTFSEGIVSGLRRARAGVYIQTTAPLSDGSSGGGLFDIQGRLIGITSFVYSAGQLLNFAAPAAWAIELARKVSADGGAKRAPAVELPPDFGQSWRPPELQ